MPFVRGRVSNQQRMIGNLRLSRKSLTSSTRRSAEISRFLGTSCPDHFVRTKIRPMFVAWDPLKKMLHKFCAKRSTRRSTHYRREYAHYYQQHAKPKIPAMRDASPTVVLIPGIGMFSFGKNKTESRITGEFYVNAIHVMEGAGIRTGARPRFCRRRGPAAETARSRSIATTSRCRPPRRFVSSTGRSKKPRCAGSLRKEFSRHIMLVVGGGSGIGREVVVVAAGAGRM